MQDLRLLGVHDDGESVVLAGSDGSRYRLRVDEALRAAVRRDRARLGQLQIQTAATLRPRDIQARIRAGESAEEVAAAGGLPVEHVRRYEGPVLAERAHVAGLARRTTPGRSHAGSSLDDVVVGRLVARAVDPDGARWDAWRAEDGWLVQIEFVAGGRGRLARWGFDPAARVLTPLDDEARWLSDDEPAEPGPLPGRRHLGLAPEGQGETGDLERVYDVEADGGVRSVGSPGGRTGRRIDPQATASADLLDVLDARRGVRPSAQTPEGDPAEVARVDALLADPPPAHPADSDTSAPEDRTILPPRATAGGADHPAVGDAAGTTVEDHAENGDAGNGAADVAVEDVAVPDVTPEDFAAEDGPAQEPAPAAPSPAAPSTDEARPVAEPAVAARPTPSSAAGAAGESATPAPTTSETTAPDPARPAETAKQAANRRRPRTNRARSGSAAKRNSVPSWDEIMFGSKKD
ncbi:septation protein SepH [Kineococcus gynurae]|uniref:Septation protein SepH n=1 Tax=Kineococcus gynurae TaxID=452979 RepID=A0ABV5LV19_9ACTN